jgi:hypothetical protein
MPDRTYTYKTTISVGDAELDVKLIYTVAWGHPGRGPSYRDGGLPADPPEITDMTVVEIGGKPRRWGFLHEGDGQLASLIEDRLMDANGIAAMLEEAAEEEACRQDRADERRYEREA